MLALERIDRRQGGGEVESCVEHMVRMIAGYRMLKNKPTTATTTEKKKLVSRPARLYGPANGQFSCRASAELAVFVRTK